MELRSLPALRVAGVRHVGSYMKIGSAFEKLHTAAVVHGLASDPRVQLVGVYHDYPETTPEDELRSDAAITMPEGVKTPESLVEQQLPGGRYACAMHNGSYETIGGTWAKLKQEVGARRGQGPSYEVYLNTPMNTPDKNDLRTEIRIPVA